MDDESFKLQPKLWGQTNQSIESNESKSRNHQDASPDMCLESDSIIL
jgi:hypothetical protein